MTYVALTLLAVLIFLSMSDFVEGVAHATAELGVTKRFFKKGQTR
jgi:hypothetical protein